MFRIGEFSKLGKTTVKTLRYYDETGLLKPEQTDPFTGYRLYTTRQLVKLHRIQSLRQAGLSIDETRAILAGQNARAVLEQRKKDLQEELRRGSDQLSRITFLLSIEKEDASMCYQATIKELPACIVYAKEMTVPSYDAYFSLIPAIGETISKKYPDLECATPEYCFLEYLDEEYKEHDFRVVFREAVKELREDFDDIYFERMEPVTVVSVMHSGAYAGLSEAYAYAFDWIEENGYTITGSPRENYIDGVWNCEKEEDWLTELQIPIARK